MQGSPVMHALLNDLLAVLSFAIAVSVAPGFWLMAHRHQLPNAVRYAGAVISIAGFHLGTACLVSSGARWLTLSALLHVVVGAALLLRALAPAETKRFFRRAVQVLFMKSAPLLKKRMS